MSRNTLTTFWKGQHASKNRFYSFLQVFFPSVFCSFFNVFFYSFLRSPGNGEWLVTLVHVTQEACQLER